MAFQIQKCHNQRNQEENRIKVLGGGMISYFFLSWCSANETWDEFPCSVLENIISPQTILFIVLGEIWTVSFLVNRKKKRKNKWLASISDYMLNTILSFKLDTFMQIYMFSSLKSGLPYINIYIYIYILPKQTIQYHCNLTLWPNH